MSQNQITIASQDIETAIYSNLSNFELLEILGAYGLQQNFASKNEALIKIRALHKQKKTFNNLLSVIQSTRSAYDVMLHASHIGMYIPVTKRYGLEAYHFYMNNVKYYEKVMDRCELSVPPPKILDIFLGDNRMNLLLSLRDDEILTPPYTYSINYSDRVNMLKHFMHMNFDTIGEFDLPSNSRTVYGTKFCTIFYSCFIVSNNSIAEFEYSTEEFLRLIDEDSKCVYTDTAKKHIFSELSLLGLRKKILEKLAQWKIRDNNNDIAAPRLYKIFQKLDRILDSKNRISSAAYLQAYLVSES